jgi:CHASE2 domain-containing sensor protein
VIGTDDDTTGGLARLHAQALAEILATPRIQQLPPVAQWLVWAVAGLVGAWLVYFVPRPLALLRGLLCIFAALVICFLAFQSRLIWCPPTLPAALIAVAALFARFAGRRLA